MGQAKAAAKAAAEAAKKVGFGVTSFGRSLGKHDGTLGTCFMFNLNCSEWIRVVWPASSTFLEIQAAQAVFLTESLGKKNQRFIFKHF